MRQLVILLLSLPLLAEAQKNNPSEFSWLTGKWGMKKGQKTYVEIWHKSGKNQWKAFSEMRQGKKVLWSEQGKIAMKKGVWHYFSQVSDQPKQGEIAFQLTSAEHDTWVFENTKHDFPNRISYTKIGTDSLFALVTGFQQGKPDTLRFPLKRMRP